MQTQVNDRPRGKPTPPIANDALMTSAQVKADCGGISDMCLWRWTRNPRVGFPKPDVVINNRKYWYAGTIRRFKAERATLGQIAIQP